MRSALLPILAFVLLLFCTGYKAQVNVYSFKQTTGSYVNLNVGTLIGPLYQNDDVTPVALPFPFKFDGSIYNSVNVCSNGYLSFGALSGTAYAPISDAATQNIISAFGQDLSMSSFASGDLTSGSNTITNLSSSIGFSVGDLLLDHNSSFGSNPTITAISGSSMVLSIPANTTNAGYLVMGLNGSIRFTLHGTSPNQFCEFQFRNFSTLTNYTNENLNFKIRLYETSNKIEIVYGTMICGANVIPAEVGLKGSSNSDFNSRKVTGNTWSASQASGAITDVCNFSPGSVPPSGLSYMWSPELCIVPALTMAPTATLVCLGSSAALNAAGADSYTWSTGSNAPSILIAPTANTSYTVSAGTLTCVVSKTVEIFVSDCTGIESYENGKTAPAFPNPFGNSLTLKNNSDNTATVSISDITGKAVSRIELAGGSSATIDTAGFDKGFYFVSFDSGNSRSVMKLIRE